MIHSLTQWIMGLLETHGAISVFIGVIIESIIVPIPSPLIIMGAGAILIDPALSFLESFPLIFLKIVLPGSLASTLGAFLGYGVAYWGGKPVIDRSQRFLGFDWEDILAMEQKYFSKNIGPILFALRALPIVPLSLISAAAGAIRMPLLQFTIWTLLGSIPRCLFLGILGWLMHDTYVSIAKGFNFVEGLVSGFIVLSAVTLIVWLRLNMAKVK